jgi:Leucine-rich repeat (LRR) protein
MNEWNHTDTQITLFCLAETLSLGLNNLSGALPVTLGDMTELRNLVLSTNFLSGPVPAELANLPNLELLDLQNNFFTGEIPAELLANTDLNIVFP